MNLVGKIHGSTNQRVDAEIVPLTFTTSDPEDFVFPIPTNLEYVGSEVLVHKGITLLLRVITKVLLNYELWLHQGTLNSLFKGPVDEERSHHHARENWPWSVEGITAFKDSMWSTWASPDTPFPHCSCKHMQQLWPKKDVITRSLVSAEIEVWTTPPHKPPRPAKLVTEGEKDLE